MSELKDKILARKYFQVYFDLTINTRRPDILASIINALTPLKEVKIQSHQTILMLDKDIEVKIGYDPFIQISSPTIKDTEKTYDKIINAITKTLEKELTR